MLKITVNSIDFVFDRNPYGTHNWCAYDYNDCDDDGNPREYFGNLWVNNFIVRLIDNVDTQQQIILKTILKLINKTYFKSVKLFSIYDLTYAESQQYSIGSRTRCYQLDKWSESYERKARLVCAKCLMAH